MNNVDIILDSIRIYSIKMLPIDSILKVYFNRYTINSWNKYLDLYINIVIKDNFFFNNLNNYILSHKPFPIKQLDINFLNDYFKIKDKIFENYKSTNIKLKLLVLKIFKF